MPKHPDIKVELIGTDSNAAVLIGKVRHALRMARVPNEEITEFTKQATSGDYEQVLTTIGEWVVIA
jgi:hypothetical protein